jgi:energy-coupling factor transporter ATP-binding protein EcfA2
MKKEESRLESRIEIEHIPKKLKSRKQWVCWRFQDREGKAAKVPVNPETGAPASIGNSDTWSSYATAVTYHGTNVDTTDGIGFVFTKADPFAGVDLDDCLTETDGIEQTADQIVSQIDSYTEVSPSGTGLHIIVEAELPEGANRSGSIELYDEKRFFTVTGNRLDGAPATIEERQAALEAIHVSHIADSSDSEIITGGGRDSADRVSLPDKVLIEKAKTAHNRESFSRLWNGDTSDYKSHSEADAALCGNLAFWTGGDQQRIDRLFRRSGLMRSKWDEQRGEQTYGELTINRAIAMTDNYYDPNFGKESTDEQLTDDVTLADVERVVCEEFDERTWDVTEAVLSAHATHLIQGQSGGTGLVITGPSGSGKTTILKFFEGLDEQIYRSDDVTPASFVSHDSSKSEEQLEEVDLLPRIKGKTLLSRDMATWFAGDQESVYKRMSIMAPLMDGDGYTRDSGSHGQRGYVGKEYRFNYIGATTPLSPRAWRVMGTVGNRLVFHEKQGTSDTDSVVDDVIDGSDYSERVQRCNAIIRTFLCQLWDTAGGVGSVEFVNSLGPGVRSALKNLTRIVRSGRATVDDDGVPHQEGGHRIADTLLNIAKGRAVLNGRRQVTVEHLEMSGRIALSTIPEKRRPLIRALLDPDQEGVLTASDVEITLGVSRPTAHNRMDLIETLELATVTESEEDGRHPKKIELKDDLRWPEELEFPVF